jgi:hypothetical protein
MKAPLQSSAVFGLVAAPPVVSSANASTLTGLPHDRRRSRRVLLVATFFVVALIGAAVAFLVPASHAVDQPNASKRATKKGAVAIPCDVSPETPTSRVSFEAN